jgi:hypothetical protein
MRFGTTTSAKYQSARPQAAKRLARVDRAHVTRFLMKSWRVWW